MRAALQKLKGGFRLICPPILLPMITSAYRGVNRAGGFSGFLPSWEQAIAAAGSADGGYSQVGILERVEQATREVLAGRAAFERDSVLFATSDYQFPLLACLLRVAALNEGRLTVLDFGGALGSTYHQCRPFFRGLRGIDWRVVEQPHYVASGKRGFATPELRFFGSIAECCADKLPNVALFSGVLQYLDDPLAQMAEVRRRGISLLVDRTPVHDGIEDRYSVQTVPSSIYSASLPIRVFGRDSIAGMAGPDYRLAASFDAVDERTVIGGTPVTFKGFFFERLENE